MVALSDLTSQLSSIEAQVPSGAPTVDPTLAFVVNAAALLLTIQTGGSVVTSSVRMNGFVVHDISVISVTLTLGCFNFHLRYLLCILVS